MQVIRSDGAGEHAHSLFFAECLSAESVTLDEAQTGHAAAVFRLRPGDRIELTDGKGCRAVGVVESIVNREMNVRIVRRTHAERLRPRVTLFVGLPGRDAFERLLLDATALGVFRIVPLEAEHCGAGWWQKWEKHLPRLRRVMITALKQSLSCFLPEIAAPCSTAEAIASAEGLVLIADVDGEPPSALPIFNDPEIAVCCFVGPPGGFSEKELQLFDQKTSLRVRMAPARLRTELAATVLCSQVLGKMS